MLCVCVSEPQPASVCMRVYITFRFGCCRMSITKIVFGWNKNDEQRRQWQGCERKGAAKAETSMWNHIICVRWHLVLEFIFKIFPDDSMYARLNPFKMTLTMEGERLYGENRWCYILIVHRLFIHSHSLATAHFQRSEVFSKCERENKWEFEIHARALAHKYFHGISASEQAQRHNENQSGMWFEISINYYYQELCTFY